MLHLRPHWRLTFGLVTAGAVWLLAAGQPGERRLAFAWIGYLVTVLFLLGLALRKAEASRLREIATREDPNRFWTFVLTAVSAAASLFLVVRLVGQAKGLPPGQEALVAILALVSVAGSWLLLHTVYAFRYAHLFYDEEAKGTCAPLLFPGNEPPDASDFLYFSYGLGMTFQTSDVGIASRRLRREATVHTLLAFAFNTGVLAVAISGVAALGGG